MIKKFLDVVVRYDPVENVVLVKPADGTSLPAEFSTFRVGEVDILELAHGIGECVVAYLNTVHPNVFVNEEMRGHSLVNDPGTENFMMAHQMIGMIGDSSSVEEVIAVESLLQRLGSAGDEDASEYLKGPWQPLKAVLLRRIRRKVDDAPLE